jgi:pimeloyl-ACP methyl ester carboxylesterase
MLLIHGISSSLDFYGPSIPLLARSFRVLAMDLLGFGGSDKPKGKAYSLQLYADLIREFLEKTDAVAGGTVYATGHSMGGKYLLATALLHPGTFDKLVLSNTDGFISLPSWARGLSLPGVRHILKPIVTRPKIAEKMLAAAIHRPDNIAPETYRRILDIAMDDGAFETVMGLNRNLLNLDLKRAGLRARLHELKIPTLIIWGDRDRYMSPKIAQVVKREIPCSKLVIIRDCGHSPMLEHPGEFSSAITEFILSEPQQENELCS